MQQTHTLPSLNCKRQPKAWTAYAITSMRCDIECCLTGQEVHWDADSADSACVSSDIWHVLERRMSACLRRRRAADMKVSC